MLLLSPSSPLRRPSRPMNRPSLYVRIQRRIFYRSKHPLLGVLFLVGLAFLRLPPAGIWDYLRAKRDQRRGRARQFTLRLRGGRRLHLRDTETDLMIFDQVFLLDDCALPKKTGRGTIRCVIDAGAHIGCSSLFYAARYPEARILAIEADAGNYRQLVRNTADTPAITPVLGAVFHLSTPVQVLNPDDRPWGFQVAAAGSPDAPGQVPGHTIPDLMRMAGFSRIDLLKLDIEGAEGELFAHGGADWLRQVRHLVIELHDDVKAGCAESFRLATRGIPHETTQRIDNLVWRNLEPPA